MPTAPGLSLGDVSGPPQGGLGRGAESRWRQAPSQPQTLPASRLSSSAFGVACVWGVLYFRDTCECSVSGIHIFWVLCVITQKTEKNRSSSPLNKLKHNIIYQLRSPSAQELQKGRYQVLKEMIIFRKILL